LIQDIVKAFKEVNGDVKSIDVLKMFDYLGNAKGVLNTKTSLSFVLDLLEKSEGEDNQCAFYKHDNYIALVYDNTDINWKLTNLNGSECVLGDQDEDVQKIILNLLNNKNCTSQNI